MLTDAQYKNIQQKIKAGTATPEEIQAIKDHDAAMEKKPEQPWFMDPNSTAAEDTIAKYNGQTSSDLAGQMLTPEQQGAIPKGNQGDNAIANPGALNTAEVTDVHQKELASAQTPENMNPGTFSPDSSIREEAEQNKAVRSVTQPKKGDTPKETKAKSRYNKSMMSIWDAYHEGLIDKETAGYFTIDAIATLAKNLGRSIGNVGAQFSGGTIDQGHDESRWEQRQDKMFNTEAQAESEEVKTFDNLLKGYQVDKASTVNDMLNDFKAKSDDPTLSETERRFFQVLAVELAGAGLDGKTQIASIGTGVWDDFKSRVDEMFGNGNK